MSVSFPLAIFGQPSSCAGVGASNEFSNHVRVCGEKTSSAATCQEYIPQVVSHYDVLVLGSGTARVHPGVSPEQGAVTLGLPRRGRAGLRAVRRRWLAGGHGRRPPARLLALVGDGSRGSLPAQSAHHRGLLGPQCLRHPRGRPGRATTSGARAGLMPTSSRTCDVPGGSLRTRRQELDEISPGHAAFAAAAGD